MFAYIAITMAAFSIAYAGNYFGEKSKVGGCLLLVLSVAIFCFFAGARDISVGSDTHGYALGSFHTALSTSFSSFYFDSWYKGWAPLYKCLCWFISNLGHSFFWYMFCVQLLTVVPVYITSYKTLDKRYAPLALLVYGLVFYPLSFNMMRQMVSMSILLFAYISANDRRPVSFCLFVLLAAAFHGSALIGAAIYPLVVLSTSKTSYLSSGIRVLVISLFSLAVIVFAPQILSFTDSIGFYSAYTSGSAITVGGGLRTVVLTVGATALIVPLGWLFIRRSSKTPRLALAGLLTTVIFGVVCLPLSLISFYLFRIGFYFLYFAVLAIPTCFSLIEDTATRLFFEMIVIALLLVWDYDYYIVLGLHDVTNYFMYFGAV